MSYPDSKNHITIMKTPLVGSTIRHTIA